MMSSNLTLHKAQRYQAKGLVGIMKSRFVRQICEKLAHTYFYEISKSILEAGKGVPEKFFEARNRPF